MKEEIIKMARKAGAIPIHKQPKELALVTVENIERFFHMAQAAEREEFARHAVDIARRAIAEEREACAKVCEAQYIADGSPEDVASTQCAAAIRERRQA